jgi:hypothetical protein
MSGVVSCLTSPACSYCCGGLSAFAVVFLLGLSSLFRANYPYLPSEWKVEGGGENQHEIAARNCFLTALIYGGFLGLSLMCCVNNKARGRTLCGSRGGATHTAGWARP